MSKLFAIVLTVSLLVGCASAVSMRKFSTLNMGMSKEEVIRDLGVPYLMRASKISPDGSVEELWEYNVYCPTHPNANGLTGNITYWITFINGKLSFYGLPGDFDSTKDPTLNLNISNK